MSMIAIWECKDSVLEFIIGLSIGLGLLSVYRKRDDAKMKRLLSRLEDRQVPSTLGV